LVRSGDLLYAWAGVKGLSFGPRIWSGPIGGLNQHIFKIKPKSKVDKRWLFEVLLLITSEIEKQAHGFKKELAHIKKSWLSDYVVPVPSRQEQCNIVAVASQWDKLLHSIKNDIECNIKLKKTITNMIVKIQ
jgi:type I restriction enzyme S subunit